MQAASGTDKKAMELQVVTNKLIATFNEKVKNISDGVAATQFYRIEN